MSGGVTESPVAQADDGIVSVGLGEGLLEEEPKGRRPQPARSVAPAISAPARHTRITTTSYVAPRGSLARRD